ncbi:MAG: HupE/UreJ family protein [Abitibacteriaceae bacterium]|nr:HupE/UreJ family protein [Abditibacteriaceae bacterium]
MQRLLLLILTLSLGIAGQAHDPQLSGLKIIWNNDDITLSVVTHASKLKAADPDAAIRQHLKVRLDDKDFVPVTSHVMRDPANDVVMWQTQYQGSVARLEVLSRLYPEDVNSRLVVSVIKQGHVVQEVLLDATHPSVVIGGSKLEGVSVGNIIIRFAHEGVLHIFGGLDHILFVFGLILMGGSLRQLLKTVTAFTLAHSITLTLAATSIYAPSPRIVEPLIALSIVAAAFENLRVHQAQLKAEKKDWRPWIAFGFGLIHGFGFAGALAEVGLPREALGWALASFNIGVELGQATIILLCAPALAWLSNSPLKWQTRLHRQVVLCGSLTIAAMGAFWFVTRLVTV